MFKEILALLSLFQTSEIFAQNLEAVLSDTRLPVPIEGMPVVYDGEDSIYVMGGNGFNNSHQKDILKFSVTTQTLEQVGTMDPVSHGSAVWTGNENVLYFGGHDGLAFEQRVWSYELDGGNDWSKIGSLSRPASQTSSVCCQGEYSYVFGGYDMEVSNTISRYSSVTNESIVVGELPSPRYGTSAIWDEFTGDAYIFGGVASSGYLNDILKFNPAKETVEKLNVTLPVAACYPRAIWTGKVAYIIGGLNFNGKVLNIARFNPSTNEVLEVPVNNLPPNLYWHGCAFVSKLNRIYVFGGVSGSVRNEIMYIDLDPNTTNPTTTTPMTTTKEPGTPTDCKNEVCGTRFPDPYCCKSFYQCRNQEAVLRQCPSQLQFNPTSGECDFPEIVKCRSVYE